MHNSFLKLVSALALVAALPMAASTHHHKTASTSSSHHTTSTQAGITTERATEIQTALIKQGYMSGEPTGKWDATSVAAMQKLQSENGWQTKFTPDARALIKLGLGSSSDETATNTASLVSTGGGL
jgi:hypothetical protein